MESKLKVVWICHFSDAKTRAHIRFSRFYFKRIIKLLLGKPDNKWIDFAVWNSNAIKQFESFKDIELTIIFPHQGIKGRSQRFVINSIYYVCFRSEDDHFWPYFKNRFLNKPCLHFFKNREFVRNTIEELKPDIVHVVGAENPYYSITALDIPKAIPSIVSLQTLLSDPDFFSNYPISKSDYEYRSSIEKDVIRHCDYLGTTIAKYRSTINRDIKPNAVFLNTRLAVGVDVDERATEKIYDFVYFAGNINKAADYAIEAFAIAHKKKSSLSLNISGYFSESYKAQLDKRLAELGIQKCVFFSGEKESHDEVLRQIKKSRYALLPLKVDMISSTIREAMACGLPVLTTRTPDTPSLNKECECVLISEIGDFKGMADNMIRLIDNKEYGELLRKNGYAIVKKLYDNKKFMEDLKVAYYRISKKRQ